MFASKIDEARVHAMRNDFGQAIPKLMECLNDNFFDSEVLFLLGTCFGYQGFNGMMAVFCTLAEQVRNGEGRHFPGAMMNLGMAYKSEFRYAEAERYLLKALQFEKKVDQRADILHNLASLFIEEAGPQKAIDYTAQALALNPRHHKARVNRGIAHLEMGNWREGWEGWKAAALSGDRLMKSYPDIPPWDGSPGKTVIVWGDQGIGDEIFFSSALPDMIKMSKRVILDCHPRLEGLFRRSFPEAEVYGTRKDLTQLPWLSGSGADAEVSLFDLFSFFRNEDEDWPGTPYLRAASELGSSPPFPETPEGKPYPPRIGLSWTGGTKKTRQHLRTIPLDLLAPILLSRPDAQWYSLQYTADAARQVCELEERTGIRISHWPGWVECYDYDRTASFVNSLDLVITVPTAVHHLAGALGVPNWMLVHGKPNWHCRLEGETLPWYNSTRIYRQTTDGDWSGPVQRVTTDLTKNFIGGRLWGG